MGEEEDPKRFRAPRITISGMVRPTYGRKSTFTPPSG
jgi:hypothetical protein